MYDDAKRSGMRGAAGFRLSLMQVWYDSGWMTRAVAKSFDQVGI